MKPIVQILTNAIRLGPLPYLILGAAIIGVGMVLQMRATTTDNLMGGGSVFGLMAKLGGAVGLFGLLTLAFGGPGTAPPPKADTAAQPLPVSAFDARIAAAASRVRPARVGTAAAPAAPAVSKAARTGLRMAGQTGARMLAQALRR